MPPSLQNSTIHWHYHLTSGCDEKEEKKKFKEKNCETMKQEGWAV